MLPFATLQRAISVSASFILLLFIYWKFHVTDSQNRNPLIPWIGLWKATYPILNLIKFVKYGYNGVGTTCTRG